MANFPKGNYAVVLAFALPLFLIIVVALFAYIPSRTLSTEFNFVYASCSDVNYGYYDVYCDNYLRKKYVVENNRLVVKELDPLLDFDKDGIPDVDEGYTDYLFLHDTSKNESREITFDEAQSMTLNGLLTSPDGVTVSYMQAKTDYFFPFGGDSSYGYYLSKGDSRKKLNVIDQLSARYYNPEIHFIGWVLP